MRISRPDTNVTTPLLRSIGSLGFQPLDINQNVSRDLVHREEPKRKRCRTLHYTPVTFIATSPTLAHRPYGVLKVPSSGQWGSPLTDPYKLLSIQDPPSTSHSEQLQRWCSALWEIDCYMLETVPLPHYITAEHNCFQDTSRIVNAALGVTCV